jgi:hypothetical protein
MRHSTQRLLRIGTGWLLVWAALMAVPPQVLAGGGGPSGWVRLPQANARPAPVKDTMAAACETQCQAMVTTLDALSLRVKAALAGNDPGQMRAALNEVVQQQTAIQDRMAMCVHMTSMMPPVHSGMGGSR